MKAPPARVAASLDPGERVVFASAKGGMTASTLPLVGLGIFGLLSGLSGWSLLGSAANLNDQATVTLAVSTFGPAVLALGLFGWMLRSRIVERRNPRFLLTPRRLAERMPDGRYTFVELDSIVGYNRYVQVIRTNRGDREVVTNEVDVLLRGDSFVRIGPLARIERLEELLELAVLSRFVDLAQLPGTDGTAAAAEQRTDFFFCPASKSEKYDYGPLFVGPTTIYRLTQVATQEWVDRLRSVLGAAADATDAEDAMRAAIASGHLGHHIEVARGRARLEPKGTGFELSFEGRDEPIDLDPGSAERLRRFLGQKPPSAYR